MHRAPFLVIAIVVLSVLRWLELLVEGALHRSVGQVIDTALALLAFLYVFVELRKVKAARWANGYVLFLLVVLPCISGSPQLASRPGPVRDAGDLDYFPEGAFNPPGEKGDGGAAHLLGLFLRAMGEPSLFGSVQQSERACYRFLWFLYPQMPVSVRLCVSKAGDGQLFVKAISHNAKVLNHKEFTLAPGTELSINTTIPISSQEIHRFSELIDKSDFWLLPAVEKQRVVYDGPMWLLEGVRNVNQYHAVYRYSLSPGPVMDLGKYLAKDLARLDDSTIIMPH